MAYQIPGAILTGDLVSDGNERHFRSSNGQGWGYYVNSSYFGGYDWVNARMIFEYDPVNNKFIMMGNGGYVASKNNVLDDGSGNVSIAGALSVTGAITGNASSASKLATARSIGVSGAVSGSANFDGSAGITISTTFSPATAAALGAVIVGTGLAVTSGGTLSLGTVGTAGTYPKVTVDQYGRVTSGSALASGDVTGALGFTPVSSTSTAWSNVSGNKTASGTNTLDDGSGNATFTGAVTASSFSGNASSATKLATARTINISGDASGTAQSFDGTANIVVPVTLASSGATAGTYTKVTVNAKGLVTSGASLASADVTGALGFTPVSSSATAWTNLSANKTASGTNTLDDGSGNMSITGAFTSTKNLTLNGGVLTNNQATVNTDASIGLNAQGTTVFTFGYHNTGNSTAGVTNAGNRFISVYDGTTWHETDIDASGNWTFPANVTVTGKIIANSRFILPVGTNLY